MPRRDHGDCSPAAGHRELPISSLALIASPFDFEKVRLMAPIRRLADLTGGRLVSGLYRALGGAPATLVSLGFRATAIDRYVTKPVWIARNLENRELLAHMEAVDDYMANMLAYPGRTFGQLYHRFFRVNELAQGKLQLTDEPRHRPRTRSPSPCSSSPASPTCSRRCRRCWRSRTCCRTPPRSRRTLRRADTWAS